MAAMEKWIKYTNNTTCHGVSNVFDHDRKLSRRLIWLLLILGTFFFMVYTISFGVSKLVNPEYTKQISVERQKSIPFPSVTICTNNMFRRNYAVKNPDVLAYIMMTAGTEGQWLTDNETLLNLAESVSLKDINQEELTEKLIKASDPDVSTIHSATGFDSVFGGNRRDWFIPVLTSLGECYQFNASKLVKSPGHKYGLRVIATFNPNHYFYNDESWGSMGFKLLPHSSDELPEVQSRGISIPPQIESFIGLQKKVTHLLPETGCVPGGSNTLDLYDTYSQSACLNECSIKYNVFHCGCKFFYDPGNYRVCLTRKEFVCVWQVSQNDSVPEMSCDCPSKCIEETFESKISGLPYPSPFINDFFKRKKMRWLTQSWEKTAIVTIYFETMDVTTIVEKSTYSIEDFFSDVGGLMGLWLGASVITWAELIEVLWDLCTNTKISQQTKITKVKPAHMGSSSTTVVTLQNRE